MVGTILISIFVGILGLLALMTILQLISMNRKHHMEEIRFDPAELSQWPTQAWQKSSPEAQGMSSSKLLEMVDYYHQKQQKNEEISIDSMTIIRNEHIVADLYFNPLFPKDEKHIINSCTKSIMSILIGIAIEKGLIKDVQVPVLSFFEDIQVEQPDERLKAMTLHDLLAMRTGWHSQDSFMYQWRGLFKMQTTDNWVKHILNLPFEAAPNTRFDYSNMASFLLSAIITQVSGMDSLTFAEKYLFGPLNITDVRWDQSPEGIYIGFARMWLKPHDMAKIGLLYLQRGRWEDKQLVSEAWVEESIKAHSFPGRYRYMYKEDQKIDFGASGGNWVFSNLVRPLTDGYGYQWWLDKDGIFSALGVGGQYILVLPAERLIVVATSKLKGKDSFLPVTMMKKFVVPDMESKTALPENEGAFQKLSEHFQPPSLSGEKIPLPELPEVAGQISGKEFRLDTSVKVNPWQHDHLKLRFDEQTKLATLSYSKQKKELIEYQIGLDNQYQITRLEGNAYAAKGEWTSPNTFSVSYELIGYSSRGKWTFTFDQDKIEVNEIGMTGDYTYEGKITP